MAGTIRLFVYEYLSAGGAGDESSQAFAELLESGTSMRDALVADFSAVDGVVVSRATCAGDADDGRSACVVDLSPLGGESAFQFVSRSARAHDLALVVAPESDGILAALRDVVGDARWLGCTTQAIAIASSKTATGRLLAAHGIATPDAWAPGRRVEPDGSGWVVKPDDGAGAIDTRRFERFDDARADLEQRSKRGEASTMQAWIAGEPLSLSLMCGGGRVELLSINRQHIAIDESGNVRYVGVSVATIEPRGARASALAAIARRVADAIPGLQGYVGIDIVDHPVRGPVVIEVNPRVTCAYVGLSAALGRNLAVDMLDSHRRWWRNHAAA